jgi:putative Mg2+ transporter-C (MgtC) family protein
MPTGIHADFEIIGYTAIALVLGWIVGYERVFRGRAAGTQVYCLVSMACCALTSATGLAPLWFGRQEMAVGISTTSIVGSLLTGIGFLGAGIIMKSGANIRGLTTAASIWSSSAIGILVGIHFLGSALGVTALFIVGMVIVPRIEQRLPGCTAILVALRYREGARLDEEEISRFLEERGLSVMPDTVTVSFDGAHYQLEVVVSASGANRDHALGRAVADLSEISSVDSFTMARTSRA